MNAENYEFKIEKRTQDIYGVLCVDHYLQGVKFPATMVVRGDSVCESHGVERMES